MSRQDVASFPGTRPTTVTGEGVAVEAPVASVALRFLSGAIDYSIYTLGATLTVMTWALRITDTNTSDAQALTGLGVIAALWALVVPVAVEVGTHGRSAGRLVTGTVVVRADGAAVRLRHSLVRAVVGIIEIWASSGVIALIACAVTPRSTRLGDLLAGTNVISVRSAAAGAPPLLMPPELAAWAAQADLQHVDSQVALAARTFLQRASSMAPQARERLAGELARTVAGQVMPPPPAGTHPERVLAAVLCERRDRELAVLRQAAARERELARASSRLPYGLGTLPGAFGSPGPVSGS